MLCLLPRQACNTAMVCCAAALLLYTSSMIVANTSQLHNNSSGMTQHDNVHDQHSLKSNQLNQGFDCDFTHLMVTPAASLRSRMRRLSVGWARSLTGCAIRTPVSWRQLRELKQDRCCNSWLGMGQKGPNASPCAIELLKVSFCSLQKTKDQQQGVC